MGRIIRDQFRGSAKRFVRLQRPIILFPERHATAGGAENGDLGSKLRVRREHFPETRRDHVRCAVQPGLASAAECAGGAQLLVVDLAGRFAPALVDGKPGHRGDAVMCKCHGMSSFLQTDAQRTDDSHGHDGHALSFYRLIAKCHLEAKLWVSAIPVDFQFEAPYKWLNGIGSLVVGGLSVEFIQRRFEIR
jgi:hypothetical protein